MNRKSVLLSKRGRLRAFAECLRWIFSEMQMVSDFYLRKTAKSPLTKMHKDVSSYTPTSFLCPVVLIQSSLCTSLLTGRQGVRLNFKIHFDVSQSFAWLTINNRKSHLCGVTESWVNFLSFHTDGFMDGVVIALTGLVKNVVGKPKLDSTFRFEDHIFSAHVILFCRWRSHTRKHS